MMRVALLCLLALAAVEARGLLSPTISAAENAYFNSHGLGVVQSGTQLGKVVQLGSGNDTLNAYVVLPPDNPAPKAAVIIFTDIYGYELNNTRLWADRLAKNDFLAVIPDFFRGDPITEATRGQMAEWRLRHPKEQVLADFKNVVAAVKKNYPFVKKIGQEGFCWGGLYSFLLSGNGTTYPKVDAAVAFHPSGITAADVDAVASPISLQSADPKLDNNVKDLYSYIEKVFAAKSKEGIPAYATYYPDMPHGFALRSNLSNPQFAINANKAFEEGAAFLKTQLLGESNPATSNASTSATSKAANASTPTTSKITSASDATKGNATATAQGGKLPGPAASVTNSSFTATAKAAAKPATAAAVVIPTVEKGAQSASSTTTKPSTAP